MTNNNDLAVEIRTLLRRLMYATIALYVITIAIVIYMFISLHRTNAALCTFRDDIQSRIVQTETFLHTHPDGFAGIPMASLQQSLEGQKRTVAALASLPCSKSVSSDS